MNTDGIEQPSSTPSRFAANPSRFLFWFSAAIVGIGSILWLVVVASVAIGVINGYGSNPRLAIVVAILFTIGLGLICVPQFLSVFRRSRRCAILVSRLSIAGIVIGLATAVIYPIVEYDYNFSPDGFEILGAVFYSIVAGLFGLNWWLHKRWLSPSPFG